MSLQCYCFSLLPYFWKMVARILADSWGANHNIVCWLRLWTPSQITLTWMSNTSTVQCISPSAYAIVDMHMEVSSPLTMLPLFLLAMLLETIILVIARGANHSIVRWLRLWIHPRLLPYQCQTHVKCISPSSYVVDVHMDVSWASLPLLTRPCFWKIARILVISWGANHIIVGWLRLWTHSRWLPHQCKTYVKCVTHFICCGCACGFVLTALPLCSCWPSCSWKTARPTRLLVIPRGKPQHSGLVEAMDPIPDYSHINVKHM
jgi:hypothetical protein